MNAVTEYARDVSTWEPWQREYRFGVLLLFPPAPLRTVVNALRHAHDPTSQAYCDAHISLTVPVPGPVSERDWLEFARAAADIEPFDLHYGPLGHALPHPGVFLSIEPREALDRLRRTLEATVPFGDAPERRWPFHPHMTVAEFISERRTLELMDELADAVPTGSYRCDAVSYAVPDERFHFTERRTLRLGPDPERRDDAL